MTSDPIPHLDRRRLLAAGALAAGSAVLSAARPDRAAAAGVPPARRQTTAAYRRRVGAYEITALSDGWLELPHSFWTYPAPERLDALLAAARRPPGRVRNGVTAYLVNTGRRLILIDAGSGGLFGPNAGAFPANLAEAGVRPDQIDAVLVTHLHPDHVGGLLAGAAPTLPNAVVRVSARDLAFWTCAENEAAAPDFSRPWFDVARRLAVAYGPRLEPFAGEGDLGDGVVALPTPGHTPGHTSYLVEDGGERIAFWGDVVVNPWIQFPVPDAGQIFDVDDDLARRTRRRALDQAAADGLLIAATHLPFPTFGHVAARGDAFAWIQEEWVYDLGVP